MVSRWEFRFFFRFVLSITFAVQTGYSAEVVGTLNQNTFWSLGNSPYHVTQDIVVDSGVTLNIEAGVVVNLDNDIRFDVNGTLIARGTSSQKIVFQPTSDTTPGSWDMIYFE